MRAEAPILPLRLTEASYAVSGKTLAGPLSVTIDAGPRTVILGPNGAGKSIMLRLCHGLLAPTSGRVEWLGAGAAAGRRRHAMVFQRPVLLRRSVLGNIVHALRLNGLGSSGVRQAGLGALDRFGLVALADRPARVLSGGEQQRLALARAWALHPQVLFLDEPTTFLDPGAVAAIEEMIDAFHRAGTKIVMTTHDLAQARRLGDEIIFVNKGHIVERDAAVVFFRRPATPEAAAFLEGELVW